MKDLIFTQRDYFNANQTADISNPIKQLQKLKSLLKENEEELFRAIHSDFKKSPYETYISELGLVYKEINSI